MVSAYKYSNKSENKLDTIIRKFTGSYKEDYQAKSYTTKKSFVDKSVQNLAVNSIIEGYFPKENLVRDMAIKRANKTLCIIISLLISIVVVSYYFVIYSEMKLNDLSKETMLLNNKNEELQNQLDTLKSFNNVDKTLQKSNILQRAGQVIETQEMTNDTPANLNKKKSKKIFAYPIGF